ncbi:MAG: HAD family hydrolase [Oscillatoriaceae bacterium SKW80]|nr:HAD family hydrolase [Oscillatoriaceae bacterium SKYG93]MCX8119482.1 HAD family hydrolase [Oscillatoriaceae bacterium SKW80]MDW8454949.1 HAD family hydrolase [Oscillatoriaceae cyanobacterium SKYGB_i_bin93]HIK28272.1 HAD family hydrolase [Oscillatoriaceae cyanobacterium M7585_C2015_266]
MVTIECKNITFTNIQAVIFDKDGTLIDTSEYLRILAQKRARLIDAQIPGIGEPLLMAFGVNGEYLDPAGLMAVGSRYENEIAAAAYIAETGRTWLESIALARRAFAEAEKLLKNTPFPPLSEGCLETLKSLFAAGVKLGILSADTTARVQEFATYYQIEKYLQLLMGVDEGASKPDPALFWQACACLGVEPSTTLMVGDSAADMEMAKKAGAAGCIGICRGTETAAHLAAADVAIANLNEIKLLQP